MPPLPSARWWLETTEIAETNLGIWVSHDVKYTNKNYCFKQKTPAVRKKEQKMSLFVSLHTFVEKPVRFSLKLLKSLICGDNDILSVSAPSSGCTVSTWALSTSSQSQSENREGSWEMTTFILRSVENICKKANQLFLKFLGHFEQHTTKHFKRGIPELHQTLLLLFLTFHSILWQLSFEI